MDTINISGLVVPCRIGIHAWEQKIKQKLVLDITVYKNIQNCQDNINETIDYSKMNELICEYLESNSFKLIETVANNIAKLIHEAFPIEKVTISVSKPQALKTAKNVSVNISR